MSMATIEPSPGTLPPSRRGRGWLWGVAIGCGAVLLLCCGGFGLVAVYMGLVVQRGLSDDPAVAQARAAEIADITLPAEFKPTASFELRVPVTGRGVLTWVLYQADSRGDSFESFILLGQLYADVPEESRDAVMQRFLKSLVDNEKIYEQVQQESEKPQTRELTIRGQKAEFLFYHGRGTVSEQKYRLVQGQFRGKAGTAILYLRADADKYDEAALMRIIESIR
jgi:hypothetical protein